jgi:transcriptional regulator with XRE-family HTH domain
VISARVRAAIAYTGLTLEEIGARSGLGRTKLRRIASVASPRGASPLELWSIADACEVPRSWLEDGYWNERDERPMPAPEHTHPFGVGPIEDRVEIMERYLVALIALERARTDPLPGNPEPTPAPERARLVQRATHLVGAEGLPALGSVRGTRDRS